MLSSIPFPDAVHNKGRRASCSFHLLVAVSVPPPSVRPSHRHKPTRLTGCRGWCNRGSKSCGTFLLRFVLADLDGLESEQPDHVGGRALLPGGNLANDPVFGNEELDGDGRPAAA